METISLKFKCKIIRILPDGFSALEKYYRIVFTDRKLKHLFSKGDEVIISIENVEKAGKEEVNDGYSVIYCTLKNYLSNGFQFVDANFENQKSTFFWNYRGFITQESMEENNYWERNTLLRIAIVRV